MIDAARQNQLARAEQPNPPAIIQTGRAIRHSAGGSDIHLAYCKADAGSGNTIVCYLDTDGTGDEITVYCKLYEGGTDLSGCAPLLEDGDEMKVVKIGDYWRSLTTFIPTDTCE